MASPKSAARSNKKRVEVIVDGHEQPFVFEVALTEFHRFQAEMMRSPGAAANNFLLNTSTEQARLKALFDEDWGLPATLLAPMIEELAPGAQALVKKS